MSFRIRQVTQGDAATLASIQTSSWKAAFSHIISAEDMDRCANRDKATAMYAKLINEGVGNGYIGEIDEKAHCIAYWDKARDTEMIGYAELICIHSLPDNWRKGYGSRMMDKVLSDMCNAGYKKVLLWVFTDNKRARAFYEARGFAPTDMTKPALGTTEVCYVKDLV